MKMPKRFVDTDIWEKEWFMSLTPTEKCLVKYVRDKCDIAGIWKPNFVLASYVIGEKVTEEMLLNIDNGKQFDKLFDNKILCIDFVKFQYGTELNANSPIHRKVLDLLSKYEIHYSTKENKVLQFNKPTIEEIKEEMMQKIDERNASIQAEKFFNYYESNGWHVGKNKMKSWRHSVAGWLSRSKIDRKSIDIREKLKAIGNVKIAEL